MGQIARIHWGFQKMGGVNGAASTFAEATGTGRHWQGCNHFSREGREGREDQTLDEWIDALVDWCVFGFSQSLVTSSPTKFHTHFFSLVCATLRR